MVLRQKTPIPGFGESRPRPLPPPRPPLGSEVGAKSCTLFSLVSSVSQLPVFMQMLQVSLAVGTAGRGPVCP